MSILHLSLAEWFEAAEAREREEHPVARLWYSSDLAPSSCERAIWLRLRGADRKRLSIAERLMFEAGHRVEKMVLEAVAASGRLVSQQGHVRPMRPSAWAWSGRFDAIVRPTGPETDGHEVLVDVKTARSNAFKRRDAFPKESHVWQVSAYFHVMRRARPRLRRAELWYVDRDGSNQPVVLAITEENGKLIPEERIIAEEARKSPLALPETPAPALRPEMTSESYPCSYCPFLGLSCHPDKELGKTPEPAKRPRAPRKVVAEAPKPEANAAGVVMSPAPPPAAEPPSSPAGFVKGLLDGKGPSP